MSLFHKHKWELIGKTYSAPSNGGSMKNCDAKTILAFLRGMTTYLFKCKDECCDAFIQKECIGKEMVNEKENI